MQDAAHVNFPRLPLMAAIALVCTALVLVGAARLARLPMSPGLSNVTVVQSRALRFEDGADGSVRIHDDATGDEIAVAAPGTNGFLRGTLRGLMRVRKRDDISLTAPFLLERLDNGQLILIDTLEGTNIDLNAFGQTNAAVFEAFLPPKGD